MNILRRILAVILLCAPAVAGASPIQWTLTDVLFEDGGTATGSFFYDADTGIYSSISITTTAGGLAPGASYSSFLVGTSGDAAVVPSALPNLAGSALLQMIFQFPLTNAGGTVYLYDPFFPAFSSFEGTCVNAACTSYDFARLVVDGGVVSAPAVVPVPGAMALLASGLVALGVLRRRA